MAYQTEIMPVKRGCVQVGQIPGTVVFYSELFFVGKGVSRDCHALSTVTFLKGIIGTVTIYCHGLL